jgi:hypothetical protein
MSESEDLCAESEDLTAVVNQAWIIIEKCRLESRSSCSSNDGKLQFTRNLFLKSISDVNEIDGKLKFNMDYKILNKYPVCRKAITFAYEISEYTLNEASRHFKAHKDSLDKFTVPSGMQIKTYKDDQLPKMSYSQMENIFKTNLGMEELGNQITSPQYSFFSKIKLCSS